MRKYEIMFIVKPDMEEVELNKQADSLKKVLTDDKAEIIEEKAMGQRDLAYEINKYKKGYYYLFLVNAESKTIDEFDRVIRLNENILRHLIINKED